jgi:Cdc6-like AAA superfamily ATPase
MRLTKGMPVSIHNFLKNRNVIYIHCITACIRSLQCRALELRQEQIDIAHFSSFKWLYSSPSPGLKEWLYAGEDIFWIKGKPGSGKSTVMKFLAEDLSTIDMLKSCFTNPSVIGLFFFRQG